jgi:hypothetical protein
VTTSGEGPAGDVALRYPTPPHPRLSARTYTICGRDDDDDDDDCDGDDDDDDGRPVAAVVQRVRSVSLATVVTFECFNDITAERLRRARQESFCRAMLHRTASATRLWRCSPLHDQHARGKTTGKTSTVATRFEKVCS